MPFAALIPLIAAAISAGGGIAGSAIQRRQSLNDIAAQNAYNSPVNQLARLREAGLPLSALDGTAQAGNQSQLPHSNEGGATHAGNSLANYIVFQTQLKQLDILKEEARLKASERKKNEAEVDYLLSGAGEDRIPTNLTRSLGAQISLEEANNKGKMVANKILSGELENQKTRQALENTKLTTEIGNMLQNRDLVREHIKGADLDNKIKEITIKYDPKMNDMHLAKMVKEIGLLKENITGRQLENAIQSIRYNIERATEGMQISMMYYDDVMKQLSYNRVQAEFKNYQQYQEFVDQVQDRLRDRSGKWKPVEDIRAIIALAYTTVTGMTGQSAGLSPILQGIGQGRTYNTNNFVIPPKQ